MNEDKKIPFGLANITIQGPNGEGIKFDTTDTLELTPIFEDINVSDFGSDGWDISPFEFETKNTIYLKNITVIVEGGEPTIKPYMEITFPADMPAEEFAALEKNLKEYAESGRPLHIEKREVIKGRYGNE